MNRSLIIIMMSIGQLSAQIITDRPDQTESAVTVGLKNLQIESGAVIEYLGEDPGSSRQIVVPSTLLRYGVTRNFELRIVSELASLKIGDSVSRGATDLEIGGKLQLRDADAGTQFAILSHLIVPTGAKKFTNDKYGIASRLAISHDVNEKIGLGYNIGYNYMGAGSGDIVYTIAMGMGLNDRVGFFIEPYGALADFDEFVLDFDAGFTFLLQKHAQIDLSFGRSATHKMKYLSAGISWKFERN